MRKNGVNKNLELIAGGICASDGFSASGVYGNVSCTEKLALIVCDKRYPVACAFSKTDPVGAPVILSKYNVRFGYARAAFINAGVANVCAEDSESSAKAVCRALAAKLGVDANEIVIASTGKIGPQYPKDEIIFALETLVKNTGRTGEHSHSAASAITTDDNAVKELSFRFYLGDVPCKIGAIVKGGKRVCPNMATTLCFLTTDVNVTPQMLQKAFSSAVNETLNCLTVDGLSSPNDTACIFASGAAGNYKISAPDSEYKKFAWALKSTLVEVVKALIKDGDESVATLICRVTGAKSSRAAKAAAKELVGSAQIKSELARGEFCAENALCALFQTGEGINVSKAEITLSSENGSLSVLSEGKPIPYSKDLAKKILSATEYTLTLALSTGNYGASAYARVDK